MAGRKGFTGSTARAYGSAILGATFWKAGTEIAGLYLGSFVTEVGECMKFKCAVPSSIDVSMLNGKVVAEDTEGAEARKLDQFAMGALAGWVMALDDLKGQGFKGFVTHDRVWIKCTELQPAVQRGYSDMPMFEVTVEP